VASVAKRTTLARPFSGLGERQPPYAGQGDLG
jgi:hypothetical protein